MNKRYILFPVILFFTFFQWVHAEQFEENESSYVFHFIYQNEKLHIDENNEFGYTVIPEAYTSKVDPKMSDYYGVIKSGKGVELERFGFNKPETMVVALNKSIFDVKAPYFANAGDIQFFSKNGKILFTFSVRQSSFCNDDNKCNADVGENYMNCSNDCPPPPEIPVSTPTQEPSTTTTNTPPATYPTQTNQEPSATVTTTSETSTETPTQKTQITLIVLVVIFIVLIVTLWKLRQFMGDQ